MPEPVSELVSLLAEASGWVLFATVLVLGIYGLVKPNPWLVPGWAFRQQVERADRAEDAVEGAQRTTEAAAAATAASTDTANAIARELAAWRRALELDRDARDESA